MYNKYLVASSLHQIQSLLNTISERTKNVTDVNDFLSSPNGMILLDAVCMNLIALGEAVKNLDKVSDGELLPKYNQIQWGGIMRMRDKIAHHYFEVDAEVVLLTVKEDIPLVKSIIDQMTKETE
ncbi:MAG: DUF86 domain-containing protein [Bacteroidales bacterium]|nr:DUF86 domain-containing protein [Bacteroidales bacterium]